MSNDSLFTFKLIGSLRSVVAVCFACVTLGFPLLIRCVMTNFSLITNYVLPADFIAITLVFQEIAVRGQCEGQALNLICQNC